MPYLESWRFTPILYIALLLAVSGCSTDPLTHRSRPMLFTQSKEAEMGGKDFRELLKDPKVAVIADGSSQQRVSQIFARLVDVAKRSAYEEQARALEWEVVLIDNDKERASISFPGGKTAVYTGLLAFAVSDSELVGALGYNIATVLARHGGERMSRSVLSQIAMLGTIGAPTEQKKEDPALDRKLKAEADRIGLLLAADAGYDPNEVLSMWVKMFGPGPRLDALREYLPEAKIHRKNAQLPTVPPIDPQ